MTQALRGQTGPLQIEPLSCDLDIWKYNLAGAFLLLILLAKKTAFQPADMEYKQGSLQENLDIVKLQEMPSLLFSPI